MRIAGTEINLRHRALEVYLSGCLGHCEGCHNKELWDFEIGVPWEDKWQDICNRFIDLKNAGVVDILWVLGGEPLDQHWGELKAFLECLHKNHIPIMLWTHKTEICPAIESYLTYAKIGPYIANDTEYVEPVFGIKLANKEQRIIKCGQEHNLFGY